MSLQRLSVVINFILFLINGNNVNSNEMHSTLVSVQNYLKERTRTVLALRVCLPLTFEFTTRRY